MTLFPGYYWIGTDPERVGGKPHIRGTRITVAFVLELVASGGSLLQIQAAYPQLAPEALQEALRFATEAVGHSQPLAPALE
ncbi:MAG: DUF433 domain-containing protein [Bacteroidia bacterium]|nr:DUF433 domain-containing protein [Bacteroidia bacterium]